MKGSKKDNWHYPEKGDLPKEGKYVIGYFADKPWVDPDDDPKYDIVALTKGLSKKDREKLPECNRKYEIWPSDEYGNNLRPYIWETFGPTVYFGQDCIAWHELPKFNEKNTKLSDNH